MSPRNDPTSRSGDAGWPPLEEVQDSLVAAVARSPADETELVWIAARSGRASNPAGSRSSAGDRGWAESGGEARSILQARVRERGRVGFHRTGGIHGGGRPSRHAAALDGAVRMALGQARMAPSSPPLPLSGPGGRRDDTPPIHDPAVASLTPEVAADLLSAGGGENDHLALEWHELRLVVANSRGAVRSAAATSLTLRVRHGDGPGAGWAAGSARSLGDLAAPRIVERAARRSAGSAATALATGALPEGRPVLLSPEAAANLVRCLADAGLTSRAFLDGTTWLAGHLDQPLFGRAVTLVDDGTDPAGLPFPFDGGGWPKRRVVMIEDGVLRSPAIDAELGRRLDRTPTPHAVTFDESRAGNLFLQPGDAEPEALRRAADGGLWIAALDDLRCTDPAAGTFRAVARGVRRIDGGELAAPLPDLGWRGDLGDVLASPLLVGAGPRVLAAHGAWGGTSAPALVLPAADRLEPYR